ncbi:MAG: TIGR04282 family arsenosugar biosynthesis glycosyltransferase [Bacteroidota bacterium]
MEEAGKGALIVFAKVPQPGNVKTRLTALITPEEAAQLYAAFLKDALDVYLEMPIDVHLYFGPSEVTLPDDLRPDGTAVHTQKGDGLGPRMAAAFAECFVAGYKQCVIIGTDHPTLPQAFVQQAFDVLDKPGAISIGPSEDGGYYLLGMNSFYPQLFDGMAYSHADVFSQTLDRAADTGASVHVLPSWYDVDEPETLQRLVRDLHVSDFPLVRTRKVLAQLEGAYPALRSQI